MNPRRFLEQSRALLPDAAESADRYASLALAYIGDAVFETLVRTRVIGGGNRPVNELNRQSANLVKAPSQSAMYHKIIHWLTEEEAAVLKRGRNAKSFSRAKNASVSDYRHATGLEALFGYLYLKGEIERVITLFTICLEHDDLECISDKDG